jgi:hypothetical protein
MNPVHSSSKTTEIYRHVSKLAISRIRSPLAKIDSDDRDFDFWKCFSWFEVTCAISNKKAAMMQVSCYIAGKNRQMDLAPFLQR